MSFILFFQELQENSKRIDWKLFKRTGRKEKKKLKREVAKKNKKGEQNVREMFKKQVANKNVRKKVFKNR